MRKLLLTLLALLLICPAMAEDAPQYFIEGDYAYSVNGDEVILEHCINAEPLPAEITLDPSAATRLLFGPLGPETVIPHHPVLSAWLPLPLSWDTLDYV